MKVRENRFKEAPRDPLAGDGVGGPCRGAGRVSQAGWDRSQLSSLERSGLPACQEILFKARRLAFTCQLSPRSGMRKGRARGPG